MTVNETPRGRPLAFSALALAVIAALAIPGAYLFSWHPLFFIVMWVLALITSLGALSTKAEPRWARRTALIITLGIFAIVAGFITLIVVAVNGPGNWPN